MIDEKLKIKREEIGPKGTKVLVWNHLDENNVWFEDSMKATETITTSEVFYNDTRARINSYGVCCKGYDHPINTIFVEPVTDLESQLLYPAYLKGHK